MLDVSVGLCDLLQHTPLDITSAPPSSVTLPPDTAVLRVIDETPKVLTIGIDSFLQVTEHIVSKNNKTAYLSTSSICCPNTVIFILNRVISIKVMPCVN